MVPISVNVNMANHVVHIYGDLKLQIEFCYGGGAGGPQWALRLTGFILGAAKIVLNGSVYCELTIRGQVLKYFDHREFCKRLYIKLAANQGFHANLIFRGPQNSL